MRLFLQWWKNSGNSFLPVFFTLMLVFGGFSALAQPANDDPCNAIPLTPGASCVFTTFDNTGATSSTGVPDPGCANFQGNDIWFSAVIPATGGLRIEADVAGLTDGGMAVYVGDCNNLTLLLCDDDSGPGFMPMLEIAGQAPGSTIYIRFWDYGGNDFGTFQLCAVEFTPPPPPANDDCIGAIPLTVNPDMSCGAVTAGTTVGATPSTAAAPTCGAAGINDDVWYGFIATGPAHAITITNVSGSGDMAMQVYSGNCGSEVPLVCSDPESMIVGGLTAGQIYFVRVWTWSSANNTRSDFNICVGTPPPPPANDECSGAVPLTVNPDMSCAITTASSTANATPSTDPAPTCAAAGINDDVWFSFVATNPAHAISISNISGSADMVMQVYSGACGAGVPLVCSDPEEMVVGGLTVGDTYFVRVWTWSTSITTFSDFNICVGTPPPPPANDECAGAIALTVNPDMSCAVTTTGTTRDATQSGGPTPTCGTGGINDDVWYSFVATNTAHIISIDNISGSSDMVMQVYSGACGVGVPLTCSDPEEMMASGLTIGETYYVRVWTWSGSTTTRSDFNICVGTPPPPPSNDDCAGAIQLTVNPDASCAIKTAGSTRSATESGGPAPTCGAAGINDDVWYSFVATNNIHILTIENTGGSSDMVMQVYSGACGLGSPIQCSDPETMHVSGLNPGETYYVRVYTWSSSAATASDFNICVGTPPPPAGNDDPCNAFLLVTDYECNFTTHHNFSATNTTGVPAPGCANYQGGDVWFKVVVPCEGGLIIDTRQGGITDGGMAAYTGTCDNLTQIGCNDDSSPNGLMPLLNLSGLTPGDTIWIRFWEYGNDVNGSFDICATNPPPPTAGTACSTAQPFCTSQTYNVPNSVNVPSLGGGGEYGCLATTPNPAWYFIQVQTAGDIIIGISQENTSGDGIDVDYAVWGPFTSAAEACTGITAGNIISCSYSPAPVETATILNAQVGDFYMLLLTNFSNTPGTITFQQTAGTGQSSCAALCDIPATNTGPVCPGQPFNLFTPGFAGATYLWTGPRCFTSTEQNPTNVVAPPIPGTYQYFVTATDTANNISCYGITEVTVLPGVRLGDDQTVNLCAGGTIDLTSFFTTTGFTTTWTLNGGAVANPAAVDLPGIYQLIAVNTDGCSDTALVDVSDDPYFFAEDTTIVSCPDSDVNLTTVFNTTGLTTAFEYGGAPVTNPAAVNAAGVYSLIVTTPQGCLDTVAITLTHNTVAAGVTVNNANCGEDGQIIINPTSGIAPFSYAISANPGMFQTNNIFDVLAGTYTITVRDSLGCTVDITGVEVETTNTLELNVPSTVAICGDNSVTITATGNATDYTWTPAPGLNTTSGPTVIAAPLQTTIYTVTATLGSCTRSADVVVNVEEPVTANAGPDMELMSGTSGTINGSFTGNVASILWTPSTGLNADDIINPTVTASGTGSTTYTLTVTSVGGCSDSDDMVLTVTPSCIRLRNAFSPNGDGNNDQWKVYDQDFCLSKVAVQVFNRYGNRVYSNSDYRNTWDGTYNGSPVPDGTYYAIVQYYMTDGTMQTVRTDLTIIR